ncbi:hypothetical protein V7S43_005078 [Phytophthora oleae]|uniref:Uncharacterized protein n=1 Tax=Phytophthora oleae TaxID=2107226 RepID=A0ABD3FUL5_9STRA
MGRKPDIVRLQFQKTEELSNKHGECYHICLHCVAAKEELAKKSKEEAEAFVIPKIRGSVVALRAHLERCPHAPEVRMAEQASTTLKAKAASFVYPKQENHRPPITQEHIDTFLQLLVEFQVANKLPDSFIENGSTVRLIECLDPRMVKHLPTRAKLRKMRLEYTKAKADEAAATSKE